MHISLLCSIDKGFNLLLQDKIIAYGSNCNIDLVQTIKYSAYSLDQCWKTLYFSTFSRNVSRILDWKIADRWIFEECEQNFRGKSRWPQNVNKILLYRNSRRIPPSSLFFKTQLEKQRFVECLLLFWPDFWQKFRLGFLQNWWLLHFRAEFCLEKLKFVTFQYLCSGFWP